MKTSVMGVHDMLSVLSASGVEARIGEVPGVESVTVNFDAGNATVRFDETRVNLADIKSDIRQLGSDAVGRSKPPMPDAHDGHTGVAPKKVDAAEPIAPKAAPAAPAAASEDNATLAKHPADAPDTPVKSP